jgi:hypothetical protein
MCLDARREYSTADRAVNNIVSPCFKNAKLVILLFGGSHHNDGETASVLA